MADYLDSMIMALSDDAKIDQLYDYYYQYTSTHPVVAQLCESDSAMTAIIDTALHHDKYMLDHRSKKPADNELTVFDKAFISLARLEDKKPAIAIWVEEIIGIRVVPPEQQADIVQAACCSRAAIISCTYPPFCLLCHLKYSQQVAMSESAAAPIPTTELDSTYDRSPNVSPADSLQSHDATSPSSISQSNNSRIKPEHLSSTSTNKNNTRPTSNSPSSSDPLTRILSTFLSARSDFTTAPKKSITRTQAAKFLRDTIENCLTFLSTRTDVQPTIEQKAVVVEMHTLLPDVIAVAEKGCGGKKRPFEVREEKRRSFDEEAGRMSKRVAVGVEGKGAEISILGRAANMHADSNTHMQISPASPLPRHQYDEPSRPRSRQYEHQHPIPHQPLHYRNRTITPHRRPSDTRPHSPAEYPGLSPWGHDAHIPRNANCTPLGGKRGGWNGRSPFQGEKRRRFEEHTRGDGYGGGSGDARGQGFEGRVDHGGRNMGARREEVVRGEDNYRPRYGVRGMSG